jgi:outer membrane protein insertion porin family
LSFGRPLFGDLTSPWRGSLSVRAEQVGVTDLLGEPKRELSVSNRFSATDVFFSVGGSLSYDTRDIIVDPKSGWYGLFSFEPVWGDTAYLKLAGNLSTYFAITDWLTLAVGVRGGTFLGQNPPYELFYSNGFNVIRGWPENGFLYGKHFGIGSVELRFPIFSPVSGVLFTDIGEFLVDPNNQAATSLGLNPTNTAQNQGLPFKYGVGLGIRLELAQLQKRRTQAIKLVQIQEYANIVSLILEVCMFPARYSWLAVDEQKSNEPKYQTQIWVG